MRVVKVVTMASAAASTATITHREFGQLLSAMDFDGLVSRLTPFVKPEPGAAASSNQIVPATTSGAASSSSTNNAINSASRSTDKKNAIGVIIAKLEQGFLSDDRFALINVSDGVRTWKCNFNVDVAQDLHAQTGCATNKKLKVSWPLPRFLQGVKNAILDQNCCSCSLEIRKGGLDGADASGSKGKDGGRKEKTSSGDVEAKLHVVLGKAGSAVEENVTFAIPLEIVEGDGGVLAVLLELAKSTERLKKNVKNISGT